MNLCTMCLSSSSLPATWQAEKATWRTIVFTLQKTQKLIVATIYLKSHFEKEKPDSGAEFKTYFCHISVQSHKSSSGCSLSQKYLRKQNPDSEQRWANRVSHKATVTCPAPCKLWSPCSFKGLQNHRLVLQWLRESFCFPCIRNIEYQDNVQSLLSSFII